MLNTLLPYFWLVLAALAAGAINAVAGGGTILTFPALLGVFAGDPAGAVLANGTSTMALAPGSLAGAWAFRGQVYSVRRWLLLLFIPSLVGGGVGSRLVTELDPKYFEALVPWLILIAALLFAVQPLLTRRKQSADEVPPTVGSQIGVVCFQLLVGIYGGYFGAGIGILMLSSLGFMGIGDIHRMNAVKNLLALCINGVAVANFAIKGVVVWKYALPMAVAAIIGAYLGGRFAQRLPKRVVRGIVMAIGFSLAGYYFFKQFAS